MTKEEQIELLKTNSSKVCQFAISGLMQGSDNDKSKAIMLALVTARYVAGDSREDLHHFLDVTYDAVLALVKNSKQKVN